MAVFPAGAGWDASVNPPLQAEEAVWVVLGHDQPGEVVPGFVKCTENRKQTLTAHKNKLLFSWQT